MPLIKKSNSELIDKIVKFCEVTSGLVMYDYQRVLSKRIIQALLFNEGEELTVLISRQGGKTQTMATLLSGLSILLPLLGKQGIEECKIFSDGIMIGIFAPTLEQVNTTYGRALGILKAKKGKEILEDPEINEKLLKKSEIRLLNGSFVKGQSGAKQSMIESKSYHLVIIEEAQDMDAEKVRKSIHPMLAAYNGTMIKVGTANKEKSEFYSAILRNRARNTKKKTQVHFEFNYKKVIKDKKKAYKNSKDKFHTYYAKFIKTEKRRLGEDSDEFRMSYNIEFLLERGIFLTDSAFERMLDTGEKTHSKDNTSDIVMGLDIAKSDAVTILTVLKIDLNHPDDFGNCHKRILNWYELKGNYEEQFLQLETILMGYKKIHKLVTDATGVGDAFTDRIRAYFTDILIEGIKFSTKTKSEMYKYLEEEIKAGRLVVPASARTRETIKYKRFKTQILGLEKKWKGAFLDVHKSKGKWSYDDYPDSLVLANWGAKDNIIFEIEKEDIFLKGQQKRRPTAYW